jgi:hypothetical protein
LRRLRALRAGTKRAFRLLCLNACIVPAVERQRRSLSRASTVAGSRHLSVHRNNQTTGERERDGRVRVVSRVPRAPRCTMVCVR